MTPRCEKREWFEVFFETCLISARTTLPDTKITNVVVNFLSQLIFIFLLFWGMVMYAYEFETKEKQKLTKIKN